MITLYLFNAIYLPTSLHNLLNFNFTYFYYFTFLI
jgi:hypothetical protein